MTDKELRKLKRPELLEIMFYLQKEADALRQENEELKQRVDELTNAAMSRQISLSPENIRELAKAVAEIQSGAPAKQNNAAGNDNPAETEN